MLGGLVEQAAADEIIGEQAIAMQRDQRRPTAAFGCLPGG
jgi:hypothetical protein